MRLVATAMVAMCLACPVFGAGITPPQLSTDLEAQGTRLYELNNNKPYVDDYPEVMTMWSDATDRSSVVQSDIAAIADLRALIGDLRKNGTQHSTPAGLTQTQLDSCNANMAKLASGTTLTKKTQMLNAKDAAASAYGAALSARDLTDSMSTNDPIEDQEVAIEDLECKVAAFTGANNDYQTALAASYSESWSTWQDLGSNITTTAARKTALEELLSQLIQDGWE